jgi:hypothetical protein
MKMQNDRTTLEVTEHIILRNFWEYYVLESPTNTDDIKECLVLGFETEIGDVPMSEIKPYIISRTKNLQEVAPAPGFRWIQ